MYNKKILVSLLFVVLIALSVSAVSAVDADEVLAVDNAVDELAVADADVLTDAQDAKAIQDLIDAAKPGDTVKLSGDYNITNSSITISGKDNLIVDGQGNTTITGYGDGNGFFYVTKSASVTIKGIKFMDSNPKNNFTYDGSVNGWGVQFNGNGAAGGTVDDCIFNDFSQAVVVKSCNNVTVKNSYFNGGYATKLVNDPTVNKEQGSKVISVGGSFYTTIENNVFDGVVLDAISIAQASGDARIIGNVFANNVYSIYFGGASTEGTFISNNRFINCGSFNGTYKGKNVLWESYPVISIQKASSGVYIDNNTFYAINNNFLIASEQGNAAHGYPSTLGDINVTNNKVIKGFDEDDVTGVTLLHILCRNGNLNPYADITVTGNEFFDGVTPLVVWSNDWGSEDANPTDIVIPAADPVQTQIAITKVLDNNATVILKDLNGKGLAGEELTYTANGVNGTVETDENGMAVIPMVGGGILAVEFAGSEGTTQYAACQASIEVQTTVVRVASHFDIPNNIITIKGYAVDTKAGEEGIAYATRLLDSEGNPISNVSISFALNDKIYNRVTNENGSFTPYHLNMVKAGRYTMAFHFGGNEKYDSTFATVCVDLDKKPINIKASAKTYKASATKSYTATLSTLPCSSADGKAHLSSGKKVTLTVNGKTFSGKTNAKGQVTFKITNLSKKGTYTAQVVFAGDNTYEAAAKSVKITIN